MPCGEGQLTPEPGTTRWHFRVWSAPRHISPLSTDDTLGDREGGQPYLERNEEVHGLPNLSLDGLA